MQGVDLCLPPRVYEDLRISPEVAVGWIFVLTDNWGRFCERFDGDLVKVRPSYQWGSRCPAGNVCSHGCGSPRPCCASAPAGFEGNAIGAFLQEVGGQGVPERMHGGRCCDPSLCRGLFEDRLNAGVRTGAAVLAFEEVRLRPVLRDVGVQLGQHFWTWGRAPVLSTLAAPDKDLLAFGDGVRTVQADQRSQARPGRAHAHGGKARNQRPATGSA